MNGFKPGRPQIGHIRPVTKASEYQRKLREERKQDPRNAHIWAMYMQFYRLANRERVLEQARQSAARKRTRELNPQRRVHTDSRGFV